jgi:hypothetical protein
MNITTANIRTSMIMRTITDMNMLMMSTIMLT